MTENVPWADPKYAEVAKEYEKEVLVVGVPGALTNFPLFGSCTRQDPVHNSYFSGLIMFVCALSFDLRRRIYTI